MLQLVNFRKSYGSVLVLKTDYLNLSPGIFWVKGENGSGKSTLLRALAGILSFDGQIILNDQMDLKKQPVGYKQRVNFAEAEPLFPEFLTGMEMINLFSSAKKAPVNQHEYFVKHMSMNEYIHEPLGTYSSGMLKKLSIILAFLGRPEIILLDEPLITLDERSLAILCTWIEEKHRKEGISFLLSSHQTVEVKGLNTIREVLVADQTIKIKA